MNKVCIKDQLAIECNFTMSYSCYAVALAGVMAIKSIRHEPFSIQPRSVIHFFT